MILLNKNSTNTVYLTLRENSSIASLPLTATTNYLFVFDSYMKGTSFNFIPISISSTSRYDIFYITETGSTFVNLTGGTISCRPGMFYGYNIYENTTDPYNLFVSGTTGTLIECGKVRILGAEEYEPTIYTGNSITFNIYER
jgi:hypothetical protein